MHILCQKKYCSFLAVLLGYTNFLQSPSIKQDLWIHTGNCFIVGYINIPCSTALHHLYFAHFYVYLFEKQLWLFSSGSLLFINEENSKKHTEEMVLSELRRLTTFAFQFSTFLNLLLCRPQKKSKVQVIRSIKIFPYASAYIVAISSSLFITNDPSSVSQCLYHIYTYLDVAIHFLQQLIQVICI